LLPPSPLLLTRERRELRFDFSAGERAGFLIFCLKEEPWRRRCFAFVRFAGERRTSPFLLCLAKVARLRICHRFAFRGPTQSGADRTLGRKLRKFVELLLQVKNLFLQIEHVTRALLRELNAALCYL
jgi:hypothetical protein